MRAGELRERITIQQNTLTRDTFGAEVPHWADLATVWAKVVATSGSEQISQAIGVATTIYSITIREREDVDTSMRVLWEGATLEIKAILGSDERGAAMLLDCREIDRG